MLYNKIQELDAWISWDCVLEESLESRSLRASQSCQIDMTKRSFQSTLCVCSEWLEFEFILNQFWSGSWKKFKVKIQEDGAKNELPMVNHVTHVEKSQFGCI